MWIWQHASVATILVRCNVTADLIHTVLLTFTICTTHYEKCLEGGQNGWQAYKRRDCEKGFRVEQSNVTFEIRLY